MIDDGKAQTTASRIEEGAGEETNRRPTAGGRPRWHQPHRKAVRAPRRSDQGGAKRPADGDHPRPLGNRAHATVFEVTKRDGPRPAAKPDEETRGVTVGAL